MLFCIMGNSGSGKDTLIDLVTANCDKIKRLKLVTDRPRRPNEDDSRYIFATKYEFDSLLDKDSFVEHREFKVASGDIWRYGTLKSMFLSAIKHKDRITTCTPKQFTEYYNLLENKEKCMLYPIVLRVSSEKERLLRTLNRIDDNFDSIREVCRRFSDDIDYLDTSKVQDYYLYNNDSENDLQKAYERVMIIYNRYITNNIMLDAHKKLISDPENLGSIYIKEDK